MCIRDSSSSLYYNKGGSGGGIKGGDGVYQSSNPEYAAYGGTQINPGESGGFNNFRIQADFGYGGSNVCYTCGDPGSGGGGGWFGGAASGYYGFGGAGGSGYVLTLNSFKPDGYVPEREYYLSRASMMNDIQYGNGAIKITILNYAGKDNVIKFRGCSSLGFSFSQLVSFITLPCVI